MARKTTRQALENLQEASGRPSDSLRPLRDWSHFYSSWLRAEEEGGVGRDGLSTTSQLEMAARAGFSGIRSLAKVTRDMLRALSPGMERSELDGQLSVVILIANSLSFHLFRGQDPVVEGGEHAKPEGSGTIPEIPAPVDYLNDVARQVESASAVPLGGDDVALHFRRLEDVIIDLAAAAGRSDQEELGDRFADVSFHLEKVAGRSSQTDFDRLRQLITKLRHSFGSSREVSLGDRYGNTDVEVTVAGDSRGFSDEMQSRETASVAAPSADVKTEARIPPPFDEQLFAQLAAPHSGKVTERARRLLLADEDIFRNPGRSLVGLAHRIGGRPPGVSEPPDTAEIKAVSELVWAYRKARKATSLKA